jgi:hypothetical protein
MQEPAFQTPPTAFHRPAGSPSRGLALLFACLLLAAGLLTGCGRSAEDIEVDRQEIEDFLRIYLPKLGEAYAQRDAALLEGLAVPKEMSRIELRTRELTERGQVYEPTFQEVTVESVSVWNHSNALITTFEVWDVRSFTLGTHLQVTESLGQKNRVKYQLKREGDSWLVLYRELAETIDS